MTLGSQQLRHSTVPTPPPAMGPQQTCVVLPVHPACHPVPRGGDRDPREQEGPAGLAHHEGAKRLRLLPLKSSAGEARGEKSC